MGSLLLRALPLAAFLALLMPAAPAMGQDEQLDEEAPPAFTPGDPGAIRWRLGAAAQYQFDADLDEDGKFSVGEFDLDGVFNYVASRDFNFSLGGRFRYENYDFGGSGGLAGVNPWDDILTLAFGATFGWRPITDLEILGGPVIQFSAESGQDLTKGFIGGGWIAGAYQISSTLTLGGGVGVVTQIKDSEQWYPVIILDWQITDTFKLTSRTGAAAFTRAGLEVVWEFAEGWQLGAGFGYDLRRFRIDDGGTGGIGEDGVGVNDRWPTWVRVSYNLSPQFGLDFYAGVMVDGRLELEDDNGNRIRKESYDPAFAIRGALRFQF